MRTRPAAPLLLLLFAITAGLFAMHTFGHAGPQPTATHKAMTTAVMPHTGTGLDIVQPVAARLVDGAGMPGMPMDPTAVCLAVLCAVAVTVAAVIMVARRRDGADRLPLLALMVRIGGRGPPPAGMGLRIADLSVLRN